jgi:hypothetical protein
MNGLIKPFFPEKLRMSAMTFGAHLLRVIPFCRPGFDIEYKADKGGQRTAGTQRDQQSKKKGIIHLEEL